MIVEAYLTGPTAQVTAVCDDRVFNESQQSISVWHDHVPNEA